MNRKLNNQSGVKESNAVLTPAERHTAINEVLTREWNSLCEDCEESRWNDCNRCIAKHDKVIEVITNELD